MFKISEFSKISQVSVKTLRYYDQLNLLKPANQPPFVVQRLQGVPLMATLIHHCRTTSRCTASTELALWIEPLQGSARQSVRMPSRNGSQPTIARLLHRI